MKYLDCVLAIDARINGVFDGPTLVSFGPLTTVEADVLEIKRRYLVDACGFTIGPRDLNFNRLFPGRFMAIEAHEASEGPTDDGSNGPWCVVGDDMDLLIDTAWDCWADHYGEREASL